MDNRKNNSKWVSLYYYRTYLSNFMNGCRKYFVIPAMIIKNLVNGANIITFMELNFNFVGWSKNLIKKNVNIEKNVYILRLWTLDILIYVHLLKGDPIPCLIEFLHEKKSNSPIKCYLMPLDIIIKHRLVIDVEF